MSEQDKYLPLNRRELIARCEALEAALREIASNGLTDLEMLDVAHAVLGCQAETACEQVKCLHPLHHGWHDRKDDCVHPMTRREFSDYEPKTEVQPK